MMPVKRNKTGIAKGKKIEKKFFQSRDLCLCALDTNSTYAKNVRRNEETMEQLSLTAGKEKENVV